MVRKKKNSKALFEVLSEGQGAVEVPGWIKNKPEDQTENQPDTELPKEELPLSTSEKTEETEVELVEAEESTTEDVEIVEPAPEAQQDEELPEIEVDAAASVEQQEEVSQPEPEVDENEDQSVAETTEAELFTIEEDAANDVSDTYIEIDEIEDDEVDDADEADEVVIEDTAPRVRHKLPYDVPMDDAPDLPMPQDEPLVQVQDERIRISMTRVGAMVALGAILVLLVAGFAFGLWVGGLRSPEPVQGQQKPLLKGVHIAGTKVGEQQATPADSDQGVLVEAGKRTPGRYYYIFEKINGTGDVDRVDADNMVKLFRDRRLPSQLVNIAKPGQPQRWALWGLHGFENPKSKAAKRYVGDIKRVGEEYFRKYGKYECKAPNPLKKRKSGN